MMTEEHAELYNFINKLTETDKLSVIAVIIEDEPYEYIEMSEQDKANFIIESLIMGINCGLYKDNTDKGAIDCAFTRILKIRAENIMPGAKWWQYYMCLIHAMSYTCKDIKLLDDIDDFIVSPSGYISIDQLRLIADKFKVAFRLRAINDKTNMIELGNKQNKGWYGNPNDAKYKFEIARIVNVYLVF